MAEMTPVYDTLNFCLLKDRLETFKKWPFSNDLACSAAKMAEAGFYQPNPMEEPDLAKCFICKKELDGWEHNDDPMAEHEKHRNTCPFVGLRKNKNETDITLEDLLTLMEKSVSQSVEKIHADKKELLQKQYQDLIKTVEKRCKKKK